MMDLKQYIFEDTFNEHQPGDEVDGKCIKCKKEGTVKILSSINRNTGETELIGPFDQKCAYLLKFGEIPLYHTLPQNNLEFIYRFAFRKELPENREFVKRTFARISILSLIGFFILYFLLYLVSFFLMLIAPILINLGSTIVWIILIILFSVSFTPLEIIHSKIGKSSIDGINIDDERGFELIFHELSWDKFFKNFHKITFYYVAYVWVFLFGTIAISGMVLAAFGIIFVFLFVISMIFAPVYLAIIFIPLIYFKNSIRLIRYGFTLFYVMITPNPIIGRNHLENFDQFWEGQIFLQDRNRSYYRRISLFTILFTALLILFPLVIPNFDLIPILTEYLIEDSFNFLSNIYNLEGYGKLSVQYLYLLILWIFVMLGVTQTRGVFVRYYELPKQVHYQLLTDYYMEESKYEDGNIPRLISGLLSSIRGIGNATMKLFCPICRKVMEQDDVLSRCPNCAAVYHETHLFEYLKRRHEMQEDAICMICKNNMNISTQN